MTRIQIELADEKLSQFEQLMKKCGIRTKKDLINNALAVLEWTVSEKEKGNIIASVNEEENKYKELCLPILSDGLARKNHQSKQELELSKV